MNKITNYRRNNSKDYKRPFKRTKRSYDIPKLVKSNTVFLKRSVVLESIGRTVTTGWGAFPYQFTLNQLPAYSELQAVFDSYRINAIKLTFTPYWDNNNWNITNTVYVLPRVYTLIDKNGIPPGQIATEAQFLEYSNSRQIVKPQEPFSIFIKKPSVEMRAGSTDNVGNASPWIDTADPTVPHHGCAAGMVIPSGSADVGFFYHVVATFYLEMKTAV